MLTNAGGRNIHNKRNRLFATSSLTTNAGACVGAQQSQADSPAQAPHNALPLKKKYDETAPVPARRTSDLMPEYRRGGL